MTCAQQCSCRCSLDQQAHRGKEQPQQSSGSPGLCGTPMRNIKLNSPHPAQCLTPPQRVFTDTSLCLLSTSLSLGRRGPTQRPRVLAGVEGSELWTPAPEEAIGMWHCLHQQQVSGLQESYHYHSRLNKEGARLDEAVSQAGPAALNTVWLSELFAGESRHSDK